MQLEGFAGRGAFVTGAAGGIGRALVAALHRAGARVFATDRAEALEEASAAFPEVRWAAMDIADPDCVRSTIDEAIGEIGPIGIGAHAAGVLSTTPLLDLAEADWQRVMEINAGGAFRVLRQLGGHMVENGGGALVLIGSNAAGIPRQNMGAYAASKAAATMMTRCLGLELAEYGVRCNIVAPGSTLTPMQTGMWSDDQGAARVIAGDLASYRTGIPLKKLATPEDIAQAAMFLLSDQAGHITMADLYVDGGATLRG